MSKTIASPLPTDICRLFTVLLASEHQLPGPAAMEAAHTMPARPAVPGAAPGPCPSLSPVPQRRWHGAAECGCSTTG